MTRIIVPSRPPLSIPLDTGQTCEVLLRVPESRVQLVFSRHECQIRVVPAEAGDCHTLPRQELPGPDGDSSTASA